MARVVATGAQDFEKIRRNNGFYVDKTAFIKEWWEQIDDVTLITRPRRFGKTLNMSMLECFFSVNYAKRGELFAGLSIWEDEKYRALQGTYPVIGLSFAAIKEKDYASARKKICQFLEDLYAKNAFLLDSGILQDTEIAYYKRVTVDMDDSDASLAICQMSNFLSRYYGKKVIILLDEYDTPMQEAYVRGYWEDLVSFTRSLFNSSFKTNPYLERAIMTGITRVSKESIFSDLNNLTVVTTTSEEYATCFGFTEQEVFEAMDEFGMDNKDEVKAWYDGFTFGSHTDIYNPWSITNFLNRKKLAAYWADSSSNSLVDRLLKTGSKDLKTKFEQLLKRKPVWSEIDEQIVYNQLDQNEDAVWSLLLASGYLKVLQTDGDDYELALTNYEVEKMFSKMIKTWFCRDKTSYNGFIEALLADDLKTMNIYMNRIAASTFSYFDGGTHPSESSNPENFYHGFVLGLLVDLQGRYVVTSNRESGFGRYDVLLEPRGKEDDGIILEFKVHDPDDEKDLRDTVQAALQQIEEKHYEQTLIDHGIPADKIRKYGFAFEGKTVLIG